MGEHFDSWIKCKEAAYLRSIQTRLLSFMRIKEKEKHKVASVFWRDRLFHKMYSHLQWPFCLCQTSKFHHQASFWSWKVAKLCINEFPNQNSWKEYSHPKRANAKNFAYKRGLVVWYFSQHLVEFGKEVRHLPAGFYLGYLRGRSSPPKMPNLRLPPTPKKVLLPLQYWHK